MDAIKNVDVSETESTDDAVNVSNKPEAERNKKTSGTAKGKKLKSGPAQSYENIIDDAELDARLGDCNQQAKQIFEQRRQSNKALHQALADSYLWWDACKRVEGRFGRYLEKGGVKFREGTGKFSYLIRLTFDLRGNGKSKEDIRLETRTVNRFATAMAAIDRQFTGKTLNLDNRDDIVAHIRKEGGVEALIQQQLRHGRKNKTDDTDVKKEELKNTQFNLMESFFLREKKRASFTAKDIQRGEGALVPLIGRVGEASKIDVVGDVPCTEEVFKNLLLNSGIGLDEVPNELNFFSEVLSLGTVIKDNMPSKYAVDDGADPRLETTDMEVCQRLLLVQGSGTGAVVALTRAESSIVLHAKPMSVFDWPVTWDVYMDTVSRRWFEKNVIPPSKRRHFSCKIAQSDATKQSDVCITMTSPQMGNPKPLHLRSYGKWAKSHTNQEKHLMVDVEPNTPWQFEATIASDEFEKINRENFREYSKLRKAKGRAAVLDMQFDNQTWKIRHPDGLTTEHTIEVSKKVKKACWMSFIASDIAAVAQKIVDFKLANAVKIHGNYKGLIWFDIETKVGSYVIYIPTVLENGETHNPKLLGRYPIDRGWKEAMKAGG